MQISETDARVANVEAEDASACPSFYGNVASGTLNGEPVYTEESHHRALGDYLSRNAVGKPTSR